MSTEFELALAEEHIATLRDALTQLYAKNERLEEQLETYRERHRGERGRYETIMRLREENEALRKRAQAVVDDWCGNTPTEELHKSWGNMRELRDALLTKESDEPNI